MDGAPVSDADEVEVQRDLDGSWIGGYELHDVDPHEGDARFRVRRQVDGVVLSRWFTGTEIRPPQSPRDVIDVTVAGDT